METEIEGRQEIIDTQRNDTQELRESEMGYGALKGRIRKHIGLSSGSNV